MGIALIAFFVLLAPCFHLSLTMYKKHPRWDAYNPFLNSLLIFSAIYLVYYYLWGLFGGLSSKSLYCYILGIWSCVFWLDYRRGFSSVQNIKIILKNSSLFEAGLFLIITGLAVFFSNRVWNIQIWDAAVSSYILFSKQIVTQGSILFPKIAEFRFNECTYFYSPLPTLYLVLERLITGNNGNRVFFSQVFPTVFFFAFVYSVYVRLKSRSFWALGSLAAISLGVVTYGYTNNMEVQAYIPFLMASFLFYFTDFIRRPELESLILAVLSLVMLGNQKASVLVMLVIAFPLLIFLNLKILRKKWSSYQKVILEGRYYLVFLGLLGVTWYLLLLAKYGSPTFPFYSVGIKVDPILGEMMKSFSSLSWPMHFYGPGYWQKLWAFYDILKLALLSLLFIPIYIFRRKFPDAILMRNAFGLVLAFGIMVRFCVQEQFFSSKFIYLIFPQIVIASGFSCFVFSRILRLVLIRLRVYQLALKATPLAFGAILASILYIHFIPTGLSQILSNHAISLKQRLSESRSAIKSLPEDSYRATLGSFLGDLSLLSGLSEEKKRKTFFIGHGDYINVLSLLSWPEAVSRNYASINDYSFFRIAQSGNLSVESFRKYLKEQGYQYVVFFDRGYVLLEQSFHLPFKSLDELAKSGFTIVARAGVGTLLEVN